MGRGQKQQREKRRSDGTERSQVNAERRGSDGRGQRAASAFERMAARAANGESVRADGGKGSER